MKNVTLRCEVCECPCTLIINIESLDKKERQEVYNRAIDNKFILYCPFEPSFDEVQWKIIKIEEIKKEKR